MGSLIGASKFDILDTNGNIVGQSKSYVGPDFSNSTITFFGLPSGDYQVIIHPLGGNGSYTLNVYTPTITLVALTSSTPGGWVNSTGYGVMNGPFYSLNITIPGMVQIDLTSIEVNFLSLLDTNGNQIATNIGSLGSSYVRAFLGVGS